MKKRLHRKLMTLLSKAGFDDDKRHEFVYHWTNGRTQSTKDLSEFELVQMIARIENDHNFENKVNEEMETVMRRKRSAVLAIASRTGIFPNGNWDLFNRFMLKSSVLHKPLHQYSIEELDKLLKQFRAIETNFNKSAKKPGTKANALKYVNPYSLN